MVGSGKRLARRAGPVRRSAQKLQFVTTVGKRQIYLKGGQWANKAGKPITLTIAEQEIAAAALRKMPGVFK